MSFDGLKQVIEKYWGFRTLRPLQEPAMRAVLDGRDSLVVLPTGGGKSLCYQAPAVLRGDTTVVVSPLIALMKDQVDGLHECQVPAIQIDSSQTAEERFAYEMDIRQGAIRLLFVSPERLVTPNFQALLRQIDVKNFAIDEAHCISHWGHDFRPEYRQLNQLKDWFPGAAVHAYTATATERVRQDICQQLRLENPEVLVGSFDRPNLAYRVTPRFELNAQVLEVLKRHPNEPGIIYCIRRKDVDELTADLKAQGIDARPYHAGMSPEDRKAAQDAFVQEHCNLIVATVAFGMGIDRSNIRFVLHTGMPKSLEHYQQETGRAGRDGLEAECVLLHSGSDFMLWKFLIEKSAEEGQADEQYVASAMQHLRDMQRYATGTVCRHRALVQYFGQKFPADTCLACDICLGDRETTPEATVLAQKILSCVARVKESFGINHVAQVLRGGAGEAIARHGHDQLSTYGLLKEHTLPVIQDWIRQLLSQGLLLQAGDEYPVLKLNAASWEAMKGKRDVKLFQPMQRRKEGAPAKSQAEQAAWEGVDRELFESLSVWRRQVAAQRGVAAFQIFSDATLRELARVRPSGLPGLRLVYGIGEVKLKEHGAALMQLIAEHCLRRDLSMDNAPGPVQGEKARSERPKTTQDRARAFELFRRGASIEQVAEQTEWTPKRVSGFLCDYIASARPASLAPWLPDDVVQRVTAAARRVGVERLKPIYVALGEQIPYDDIRLVLAHLGAGEQNPTG
ncbi:MAG: DNA helicase RecQ [Planctomycetia bacterium]|nr:DNA helicase RecQ [Planctomycetia bacterium]